MSWIKWALSLAPVVEQFWFLTTWEKKEQVWVLDLKKKKNPEASRKTWDNWITKAIYIGIMFIPNHA